MATENYGVNAQLINSVASTPVSTDTVLIFIGACASGDLNKPYLITSMSDYETLLGGSSDDGYNLTEAAIAAFQIAGLNKIYMIPVSHSKTFNAADYKGNAETFTGVHAVEKLFIDSPTAVNILCMPGIVDGSCISEIMGVSKKAGGHWDSFVVVDQDIPDDSVSKDVFIDPSKVSKNVTDEQAVECLGKIKTTGGSIVSLSVIRACLMALSDSDYGVPARSGGNLNIPNMISWGGILRDPEALPYTWTAGATDYTVTLTGITDNGTVHVKGTVGQGESGTKSIDDDIPYTSGVLTIETTGIDGGNQSVDVVIERAEKGYRAIVLSESMGTQLSANGICSIINYGGGLYHTWGDHTSAFTNGSVSDERARFDNTIRMNIMITNRFQLKYRFEIDNPMTLQMRNNVINEQLDYLNSLVAIGALIGEPTVEFRAIDNGNDQISQGYFTWTTQDTPTIPAKYMLNKVAYTQAGLSVYLQSE